MYSKILSEHAMNPQNRYEMMPPTSKAVARYQRCGDELTMYFQIRDNVLVQVSFTARGCGPVIAAASMATTLLKGMTVSEALKWSSFELHDALGGLPPAKRHALLLVLECLHEALKQNQEPNLNKGNQQS